MNFRAENLKDHLEKKYKATISIGDKEVSMGFIYNSEVIVVLELLIEGDFDFEFRNGDIIVTYKVFEEFEEALEDYDLFG